MALPNPLEAFVWGANGARMTPDEVAREREVAEALLAQGIDTSPVAHPLQGLARVATAAAGAYRRNKADSAYKSGREGAVTKIAKILGGVTGESPVKPAKAPSGAPTAASGSGSYRDAIASIESGGRYDAIGPTHPKMGRALGKYQVMEANVGPWSREALGREVSADEFLASPELQDAIFDHKFGGYVNQFGPEGAAQAWFAGPGGVGKTNRKDVLGTDVGSYGAKFMKALGNSPAAMVPPDPVQVASLDPSAGVGQQFGSIQPGPATITPVQDPSVLTPEPPTDTIVGQDITPQPDQWAGMRDPVQQVAQAMPQQAPVQMAQAGPSMEQLIEAASDPYLSDGERGVVNALLEQQMQQNDPMRQLQMQRMQQEIDAANGPQYKVVPGRDGAMFRVDERKGTVEQIYGGKPDTFRTLTPEEEVKFGLDPAGAYQMGADNKISKIGGEGTTVNIDQRAEGAFEKKAAESQAEAFSTMASEGLNASADLAVINELDTLLKGQGGMGTGLMGWMAQRGIDVGEATSDLQAAQALINKLVPSQRQAGSGSMSDRDVELFTRSLPSLWNTPGGNEKIVNVMRGLAQYRADQGEIADMVITGEITRQEGRRMLRELKNPLQGFKPPEKEAGGEAAKTDRVQKRIQDMTDEELEAISNGR